MSVELTQSLSLSLHLPSKPKIWLERLMLREINPADICADLDSLFKIYPELAGDKSAIGESDFYGDCQSWKNNPGWWKDLLHNLSAIE